MDQKFRIIFIALLASASEAFSTQTEEIESTPPKSQALLTQAFQPSHTSAPSGNLSQLSIQTVINTQPPSPVLQKPSAPPPHRVSPSSVSPLETLANLEKLHASLGQEIQQLKNQIAPTLPVSSAASSILAQQSPPKGGLAPHIEVEEKNKKGHDHPNRILSSTEKSKTPGTKRKHTPKAQKKPRTKSHSQHRATSREKYKLVLTSAYPQTSAFPQVPKDNPQNKRPSSHQGPAKRQRVEDISNS